jgi:hypothetical protein
MSTLESRYRMLSLESPNTEGFDPGTRVAYIAPWDATGEVVEIVPEERELGFVRVGFDMGGVHVCHVKNLKVIK